MIHATRTALDRLRRPIYAVTAVVAVVTSSLVLWYTFYGVVMPRQRFSNAILGGCVLIYYLDRAHRLLDREEPLNRREVATAIALLLIGVIGFAAAVYVHINYYQWQSFSVTLIYENIDLVIGAIIMFVVIDMTFRSFGWVLGSAVVVALLYGVLGAYLPGTLGHSGLSIPGLISRQTIVLDGVYGTLLQIGATWVAIFLVFAGLVEAHRGFDFIYRLGRRAASLSRSGIAQSAVISSMFIGMLVGGSSVNVALTGSFTIPMMKEHKVPPKVAGAIESLASTGGQILPPVMGLAAFLIADFIGVRYADVVIAAVIPAFLFYGTVAIAVHIYVVSAPWSTERGERTSESLAERLGFAIEGLQYLMPLFVLTYALVVARLPIMLAGAYTIGVFIALRGIYAFTPLSDDPVSLHRVRTFVWNTVDGLRLGAIRLAPFMGLLGALGMLIDVIAFSGLGLRVATTIVVAGDGSFVIVLLLTMIISILFGLGMPTPAAYIVVAAVLAPALVRIGTADMTAHLFVFYFALMSSITPPVAVAVAIASEIAEADFLETAKITLILGGPVFVIPFLFVAHPSLIDWTYPDVVYNFLLASIGIIGLIFALTGTNGRRDFGYVERAIFLGMFPIIAFFPSLWVRILGALVVVALAVRHLVTRRVLSPRAEGT